MRFSLVLADFQSTLHPSACIAPSSSSPPGLWARVETQRNDHTDCLRCLSFTSGLFCPETIQLVRTEQIPAANNVPIASTFHSGVSSLFVLESGPFPQQQLFSFLKHCTRSLTQMPVFSNVRSDDVNKFLTKFFFVDSGRGKIQPHHINKSKESLFPLLKKNDSIKSEYCLVVNDAEYSHLFLNECHLWFIHSS